MFRNFRGGKGKWLRRIWKMFTGSPCGHITRHKERGLPNIDGVTLGAESSDESEE